MKYKVEFSKAADKQLGSIPTSDVKKIIKRIEKLSFDPFPHGYEHIKGNHIETYRIRQGDYRILYTVYEEQLIVLVSNSINSRHYFGHLFPPSFALALDNSIQVAVALRALLGRKICTK